jgi:hypothetical protein
VFDVGDCGVGCMDDTACNYDADATIGGDCDYSCIGCTDSSAANYCDTCTIDDGTCISSCTMIYVNMTDTYGDGWNQNVLTITDGAGNVSESTIMDGNGDFTTNVFTTYEGAYATTVELCLADGCASMSWTTGSYVTETAFTITDGDGNVLASGQDGNLSQDSFGVNDDSCVAYGCNDTNADNYDETATANDGSCEYSCEYLLSYDSYINSAYDNSFSNYLCLILYIIDNPIHNTNNNS